MKLLQKVVTKIIAIDEVLTKLLQKNKTVMRLTFKEHGKENLPKFIFYISMHYF